jgi:hypothetical protein
VAFHPVYFELHSANPGVSSKIQGGGEKRKLFSEKTEKPGEREREKCFALSFEIPHTKREKNFL